jgi:hypothetical protein
MPVCAVNILILPCHGVICGILYDGLTEEIEDCKVKGKYQDFNDDGVN